MAIIKNGALFGKYHYAFAIMIGCCFLQAFGMGLILNSSSLFVVPVSTELGFTRASFSTYMTGYFLGTIIATPIAGTLLQNHNIRVVMSIAVVFLSGATIMMSTYTEMWQWQISGLIWGLAGAFVFVLPAAMLIGNWFVKRKGVMYGIVMAFSGIGGAVFSQVINGIILADGWRTGYLLMGILCLCFILPWTLFVFRNKPADMNMLPYGFVASAETMAECKEKVPPMRGVACKKAIVSVSFVCLFIFAGIAAFCHSGIDTHLPAHIVSIGFSSAFGATILSAMSIGSVADKLIMGWLNDKLGVQRTTIIQLGMVTLGLIGFLYAREPAILIFAAILFGTQDSLMSVSVPLLIREIFGNMDYTRIHSWIRVGVGVFGLFAATFVGWLFDSSGSYTLAFQLAAGLYVINVFLIVFAYRFRKKLVWTDENAEGIRKAKTCPQIPL